MLSFDEACSLLDEIVPFLRECGGVYKHINGACEGMILECLALDKYIVHRDNSGAISHFICYWMVAPEEVGSIKAKARPASVIDGTTMYVVEHASKDGRKGMTRMIRELRLKEPQVKAATWHHKGESFKAFDQRGGIK